MANIPTDPMINLIASGRILTQPDRFYGNPTVLEIDLEHLAARMKNRLKLAITWLQPLRDRFSGVAEPTITTAIDTSIDMMVDTMMAILYNRLRSIANLVSPAIRRLRMNTPSPISNIFEFPVYLASTLNSIGPLRIQDGPEDLLAIYATDATRMQNFGRANPFHFNHGMLTRFLDALRAIGIQMAPIDTAPTEQGSFFTTIIPTFDHSSWNFTGTVHQSHYENEDIVRAYLTLNDDINFRPFQYCSMMIGECTTTAVVKAVAAAKPENVCPTADGTTGPVAPIGFCFHTNIFGVRPAVAAAGTTPAVPAAVYLVGRGNVRYYSNSLARGRAEDELIAMLRHRIVHFTN